MIPTATTQNWQIGTTPQILANIHQEDTNITIYERDIAHLQEEMDALLRTPIEVRSSGSVETICQELAQVVRPSKYPGMFQDVQTLLLHFQNVASSGKLRLLLATVATNMCRKFHTDVNNLRLLCTYRGPGTLWLPDDNVNRSALNSCGHAGCIAREEALIQQAATGAVVILKGATYPYPGTQAVVHRSPSIENSGETRLLLRVDTEETINLWT
ncbi:MAG: DUF1826 domain-containing protein [Bacteroidota bacterium]